MRRQENSRWPRRLALVLAVCMVLLPHLGAVAQMDRVYTSLQEVTNPDEVYHLRLAHKRLRAIPPQVFTFVNLRTLDLHDNRIDSIPPDIALLRHLEVLKMGNNRIASLPLEVGLVVTLRELDLNRNPLEVLPDELAYLPELQRLILWRTGVYRVPDAFAALDGVLRLLDLRSCMISLAEQHDISAVLPNTRILLDQACNCK